MKKLFNYALKITNCLFLSLCLSLLLAGCENFMDGGEVKQQLDAEIAYANAEECTLIVKSESEKGYFLSEGEKTCKVGYTIEVQFTLNRDSYKFNGLEAVNKNDSTQSLGNLVEFTLVESDERSGNYKISIKLLEYSNDILIRPNCILIPKISEITPHNESAGCDQDSLISIKFNKAVDAASFADFNNISVSADGILLDDYFGTPYFSGDSTILYIAPLSANDSSKLILTPDDSRSFLDITVDINFEEGKQKDVDGLVLSGSHSHKYRINKNWGNQEKVTLTVNSDPVYGTYLSSGEKECTVGFAIELQFTLNTETYVFEGLEAVSMTDNTVLVDCIDFSIITQDIETGVFKIMAIVKKSAQNILIRPKCSLIPNSQITVNGSNGKFTPAKGTYTCFKNRSYSIGFDPDDDYEFIRWQIFDDSTGSEFENGTYITLEDIGKATTNYALKTIPPENLKLVIRPLVAERPQILLTSPAYDPAGSWSDTTVQVVFDYDMDASSVYFSKEEIEELYAEGISYSDFIPPVDESELTSEGELKNHYGYKKNVKGNEDYFYKNIMIEDKRTGQNLTKYYGEPFFDDPTTLFIPVVDSSKLEEGMNIKVMIDKGFYYKKDGVKVAMNRSEKWLYLTTGQTDNIKPGYTLGGFSIADCTVPTDGETEIQLANDGSNIASLLDGKFRTVNNMTMTLTDLQVTDTGSNPDSSFNVVYRKVYDSNYTKINEPERKTQKIGYKSVKGQIARFSGDVELTGLEDGIYEITLELKDRSSNAAIYPAPENDTAKAYYICVDTKPLSSSSPSLAFTGCPSSGKTNLQFNYSTTDKDLDHTIIKCREYTGNTDESSWNSVSGTRFARGALLSVPQLTNGKRYEVHAEFFDVAGHSSSTVASRYTMPNKVSGINIAQEAVPTDTSGNYTGKAVLSWTKPVGALDSYTIEVYTRDFNDYDQSGYKDTYTKQKTVTVQNNKNNCEILELPHSYNFYNIPVYKFRIVSVLEGSQYSYCYEDKIEMAAPPATPAPAKLKYNTSGYSGSYGLYAENISKPVVSYTGSTLGNFWNTNHNYYKVYLYLGEKESDVKDLAKASVVELQWESTNYSDGYNLKGLSFNIMDKVPWFVNEYTNSWRETTYTYGYNGSSIYYALKTVYNNDQGYESASWSDVKHFPPEKENLTYTVKQIIEDRQWRTVNVVYLGGSGRREIKWRKKGTSTWNTGDLNGQGCIEGTGASASANVEHTIGHTYSYAEFESGIYEMIVESRVNMISSSSYNTTHDVINDRTQIEVTIP